MPRYKYIAMDAKGQETEGILDADGQTQAINLIRSKGFFPTKIVELTTSGGAASKQSASQAVVQASVKGAVKTRGPISIKLPRLFGGKVKPKQLMTFTRQLATLQDAGLPLLRALKILLKQERNPTLREAINAMGEAVESGSTFSDALSQHPKIFDRLFVNMVKAGEAGGVLDVVLSRLAEFMEKAERIKNKVKSAMIYPLVVLSAAVLILIFLLTNVIPKFSQIFKELLGDEGLPPLTQFVINISEFVKNQWYILIGAIVFIFVAIKLMGRTKKGSFILDKTKLRMPIFGTLFLKAAIARFTRTLGTLMTSGVPILQALNIVRDTAGNDVIAAAIQTVHDAVKEGENMATPLESTGVFPDMVVSMVDVGEETGALPEMLMKVADNYDDEVDTAVEGLTSIIEPIMIVILAVIIGTIVIAMFVPLVTIITKMSQ